MFRYSITPEIRTNVERIERLRVVLDAAGPLPRIWLGRTRQDMEAEAVAASTRMEGVAVTVDEARRILVGDRPAGVTADDAALVAGYRDAMHYVLARADDPNFAWHTELLLAIHHRVMAGAFDRGAGRLRAQQNWVSNRGSGAQVYLPPAADQVPRLAAELSSWLSAPGCPGPVAAALGHVTMAAIHPFRDGNGRTARIVASLVMYRSGYRAPHFTSLEEWWGRHLAEYYDAFACLGAGWDAQADVTPFVSVHVAAQATQVEALSLRNAVDRAVWTALENTAVYDARLHERTTHALYDAFFGREVTNRYYRGMADVSSVTASHDLGRLVASGMLSVLGAGRSARYVGTEALMRAVVHASTIGEAWLRPGATLTDQRDGVLTGLGQRLHGGAS
jgi:Fic family protein